MYICFINRLVKYDTKLATRIINGIKDMLSSLGNKIKNIKNKTARGIYEFYRKAERLYMKAIQESGYMYSNRQIVSANQEEEESVDNEEEIRYSRVAKSIPYFKLNVQTIVALKKELADLYGTMQNGIANGVAIEQGNTVYIIDSGIEDGEISFGVRRRITISDPILRKERLSKINERAISNGFISEPLFGKIRSSSSNNSNSRVRRQLQRKLSDNNGKTEHNEGRVSSSDETGGVRRLNIPPNKKSEDSDVKYSRKPVTISASDVERLRTIAAAHSGERVSINSFTSEDIQKAEPWARKFYQELGTKSPFFRAWFGDWREHDHSQINVIEVDSIDLEDAVYESGYYGNHDTGWIIHAGKTLREETIHYARGKKISARVLSSIEKILNNAVLLDTEISTPNAKKKTHGTAFMHKLYALVLYNGSPYVAKISVEEFFDEGTSSVKRKGYHLIAIKTEAADGRSVDFSTTASRSGTTSIYRISDLHDFVKQYDKDFHPKTVNPLLLNEDGTPKVFYHGTDQQFTVFDPAEMQDREGSFFFAENHEDAEGYGSNIYEVYLQANNLANYDDQPLEFYRLRNKRAQVAWLKERGYDGWYADMDSDGWGELSVFSNTQIKSATDNIGTFDGENPDIRYSRKADFVAKLQIALKECSKSEYWIELLLESGYYNDKSILDKCTELKRMLIASINTAKENNKCKRYYPLFS